MKRLLFLSLCVAALCVAAKAEDVQQDSTVSVIAWFQKEDAAQYVANQKEYAFAKGDTVILYSINERFRIEVTDSTELGYKLAFTILDEWYDSIPDSETADLIGKINTKGQHLVKDTKVLFETNDCGAITSFTNLDEIRDKATLFYAAVKDDIVNEEEIEILEENGVNVAEMLDESNITKLVNGFVEELQLLFCNHGKAVQLGTHTSHEEESGATIDKLTKVVRSEDTGVYAILSANEILIPQYMLRDKIKEELEDMTENQDIVDAAVAEYDHQIVFDSEVRGITAHHFTPDGWPYNVSMIVVSCIGTQGKIIEKHIVREE